MAVFETNMATGLLRAMLRAVNMVGGYCETTELYASDGTTLLKTRTWAGAGADFDVPSGGRCIMKTTKTTTHSANGTIAKMRTADGVQAVHKTGLVAGLTGNKDLVVDDEVITAAELATITSFYIDIPTKGSGGVLFNTLLRNRLLKAYVKQNTAHFSAVGTVKVYNGTPPGTADDAATGTELISFTTSTTTWADASSNACALTASVNATAGASGTPSYARFSWTSGGETYVIQGSCGTVGTEDFVVSASPLVATTSYNLTTATFAWQ